MTDPADTAPTAAAAGPLRVGRREAGRLVEAREQPPGVPAPEGWDVLTAEEWDAAGAPAADARGPEERAAAALARARGECTAALLAWLDEIAEGITGRVPRAERDSWPQKEIAARALLAGKPEPEDRLLLAAEARLTGETEADLAGKIVANADAYRALIGALSAVRRTGSEAIRAADDPAAALAQAQARWAALAQGVGDKGP
jgi:hypothetical protein